MKKSTTINLVLVTLLFASCVQNNRQRNKERLFMRTDSAGSYSRMPYYNSYHGVYPYYMFHSYGSYSNNGVYSRSGFSSSSIHSSSNAISRSSSVSRGGFGHSSFHTVSA